MRNIYFVILHYQNKEDTLNCVDSIERLYRKESLKVNIVLVDNCSPNNSGVELKDKYKDREDIKCILLDKNYGFSKANNIGYEYCKKNQADIILVINNDIIIEDLDFINKLLEDTEDYDVIAPDIINLSNQHQNPLKKEPYSLKKAIKNMIYEQLFFIILHIPVFRKIFIYYKGKREERWFDKYYKNNIEIPTDISNFVPFGAFLIYANNWIKNENKAFVSDTFMYAEEDMLALYIKNRRYKIFYDPNLIVKHLEGQSTKKSNGNMYEILKFKSKNKAKALKEYIRFYRNLNEEK